MNSIGRYQLTEKLGQGGMGVVYRAFDTLLQRVVAVKLISGSIQAGPEQRERFFREARAAGQLSHRNIITIHDLGEHEGQPYLAMEYLEGEDLQHRLARPERMSLARKVELALEICDALEYAHARGVVHRDIKPANIFITESGTAKILDFGLARLMTSELTNSNMMMGTVNYMAPEQVRGERADHRSDIFSVGVVLYELLGGRRAFEAESFAATLYKILQETPEPLPHLDPNLPPGLVKVVDRAMAKPRDERYQHMSEMLQDLVVCRHELQLVAFESPASGRPASGGQARPADGSVSRPPSDSGPDAPTMAPGRTPLPTPAHPSSSAPPPAAPAPSHAQGGSGVHPLGARRGVWGAAAAVLVLGAAAAIFFMVRSPGGPPATVAPSPADAAEQRVVEAALHQATQALEAGDLEDAQRHADEVLAVAPEHEEARRIRERAAATLEGVARGLREARAHFEAGRYEDASREAGEVLSLVPRHDEAQALMEDAAKRSRGRGADEARSRMSRAKAAARAANSASLASAAYDAALGAERNAQRLYDAGQLAEATARFYEASGLFRSAELSAQAEAAARAERARALEAEKQRALEAEKQRALEAEKQRAAAERERAPAVREAPLPQPAEPASAPPTRRAEPPPVAAPAAPPVTLPKAAAPPPAPAEPSPETAIVQLLANYEAALEARSLTALKQLWPGLGGGQESAIRNEFAHASRIEVEIASPRIEVSGGTASATFRRRYELVTTDGQRLSSESVTTMNLRKTGAGWVIAQVRFEPIR